MKSHFTKPFLYSLITRQEKFIKDKVINSHLATKGSLALPHRSGFVDSSSSSLLLPSSEASRLNLVLLHLIPHLLHFPLLDHPFRFYVLLPLQVRRTLRFLPRLEMQRHDHLQHHCRQRHYRRHFGCHPLRNCQVDLSHFFQNLY